jgi:hypothetical protein
LSKVDLISINAERFFFAPVNATHAARFRIALAVTLPVFFWSNGLELSQEWITVPWLSELYEHIFLTTPYWLLIIGVILLFGAGWRSRATGLSLVLILLPFDFLSDGQLSRQVILFALFAFLFLRSDTRLSLRRSSQEDEPISAGPIWPIRLIQLQLSVLYGVNALAKTTPEYLSGEVLIAMSQTLRNFLVDLSDGYLHFGPLATPVALVALASVVIEYYLAIGFWFRRLRIITAAVGVGFHLILMMIIEIHMLDWASMFLYLAFLLPFDRPRTKELSELKGRQVAPTTRQHYMRLENNECISHNRQYG